MVASDFLLRTKLYPPSQRPTLVARPRLHALLAEGLIRPLTLVSAPAGFGKTTMVNEWHNSPAGKDFSLAWISLDKDDNHPYRFLRYLVAAIGELEKRISEPALAALQLQQPPSETAILTALVNDLNSLSIPFALVLDDYHLITAQAVHEIILFLLDHLPPSMHIVLLTRTDPPLPLARLRARDQLTEIRIPQLRFLSDETSRFLNGKMQLGLSKADIDALETRTEGWIAGLQLAAISLQQQSDRHSFVSAFAGDDRYIMDYLLEEVLQHQTPEIQDFLLKTSFLERLSAPLCQAVTDQEDSQSILMELEHTNLFIFSLDNKRCYYRYHSLFADLLQHRLRQLLSPQERLELIRRACAWYEKEGLIINAISQAFASHDYSLAVQLLERHVLTVFFRSETMLVHHWLQSLPEETLRQSPLLSTVYAHTIVHSATFWTKSLQSAKHWLETAEEAIAIPGSNRPNDNLTRCFIGLSHAYLALWSREPPDVTLKLAQTALDALPPEDKMPIDPNFQRLRSGLTNNMAFCLWYLGDEEAALQAFMEAQRIGKACGDLLNWYTAVAVQCNLLFLHGRLSEALSICRNVLASHPEKADELERPIPYAAAVYLCLGKILLERNKLDEAEAALLKSMELSRWAASTNERAETSIALARLQQARGNLHEAFTLLNQAKLELPQEANLIQAYEVRLHLADSYAHPGSLKEALHWAVGRALQPIEPTKSSFESLTLARVIIAQHRLAAQTTTAILPDFQHLMDYLNEQIQDVQVHGHDEWLIGLYLVQALAWQALDCPPKARESLINALTIARPGGFIRIFLDEGAPIRRLLARMKIEEPELAEYIRHILLEGTKMEPSLSVPASAQKLIEPLTNRELEVLNFLAQGATNIEISRRLVISLDTVKRHVTHIFEKLAVPNRAEAIQRAQDLGLLTPP